MAVYAIGDIQGCYDPLRRLLDLLRFDPAADSLWLVGDLVNRGPHSVEVLRLLRGLDERVVAVLGNHDLTLLAVVAGQVKPKRKDTFHSILDAPDRDELLNWLRWRPLLHHDPALGFTMVHAGLPPQWDLALAQRCAAEVEAVLRGPKVQDFLARMFGSEPHRWKSDLSGYDRLRFIVNALTRMRFCTVDGTLSLAEKGPPGSQNKGLWPWFAAPERRSASLNIVFGHWASLGFYRAPGIYALDSGCVWGNRLTAIRLDDPSIPIWSVPALDLPPLPA
ncbi:MAG: symmetrical bis(5'-nucleosyl)-tetraphosphatase [Candidatus Competibacter sp.]|nr:symmetrical bis(5'-nucleosyl)-tetraphosphatase [Candidatus Competibacter sp.]MDG4607006.1 symmetrical bis(5'-nucleosyl)-tetraphosphatase [Candidatus Contendobacter sp.]HRD50764.1 symmetrical bis(5'-nucleosyl)-tetraphosphatase [Candidatus Contendobacter sp.]